MHINLRFIRRGAVFLIFMMAPGIAMALPKVCKSPHYFFSKEFLNCEPKAAGEARCFNLARAEVKRYRDKFKRCAKNEDLLMQIHTPTNGRGNRVTNKAIIMVHGMNASPEFWKEQIKEYTDKGYNVIVPLLRGHGRNVSDLSEVTAQHWRMDVQFALSIARRTGMEVECMGHSLGAALVLENALSYQDEELLEPGLFPRLREVFLKPGKRRKSIAKKNPTAPRRSPCSHVYLLDPPRKPKGPVLNIASRIACNKRDENTFADELREGMGIKGEEYLSKLRCEEEDLPYHYNRFNLNTLCEASKLMTTNQVKAEELSEIPITIVYSQDEEFRPFQNEKVAEKISELSNAQVSYLPKGCTHAMIPVEHCNPEKCNRALDTALMGSSRTRPAYSGKSQSDRENER